jgi:hypothetical protein
MTKMKRKTCAASQVIALDKGERSSDLESLPGFRRQRLPSKTLSGAFLPPQKLP